jgi:outer membrane lipoprotein-sorting protein
MYEPPRRWDANQQRYLGMTAPVFDALIIGSILVVLVVVWILAFRAWIPAAADPRGILGMKGEGSAIAEVFEGGANADLKKVFSASAASFNEDVESFRGDAQVAVSVDGGAPTTIDMRYSFGADGRMYMQMDMPSGHAEMLMDLPNMYLRPSGQDWYLMTAEALGINPQAYQSLSKRRGLVDYSAQAGLMNTVIQLPSEEIDGEEYFHYGGKVEFTQALNDLPPGLLDPALLAQAAQTSGPIRIETWLDKETALPRRMTVEVDVSMETTNVSVDMRMDFLDYSEPAYIPDTPTDAKPITELNVADLRLAAAA